MRTHDGEDGNGLQAVKFRRYHLFDLFVSVYMLHETSQCFMTHSRDFCFVSKERIEVSPRGPGGKLKTQNECEGEVGGGGEGGPASSSLF